MTRRALLGALAITVLLAGCGGGGGKSSTTSAADWANGYCSAAATWVTAFQSARSEAKSSAKQTTAATAIDNAVSQVSGATTTFTLALHGLGKPDTPDGATSEATATSLGNVVQGHVARAAAATQTNNSKVTDAQKAAVVKTEATQSIAAVADSTAQLAKEDPALGKAMAASSDCATLKTDIAKG